MTQVHETLLRSVYLDENKLLVVRDVSEYSRLHDHEFLELAYVLHGSAEHQMGTQISTIREGDFLMVDLGSLHGYHGGQELEIINCLFAPEYVDRALVNCPSLQAVCPPACVSLAAIYWKADRQTASCMTVTVRSAV